VKCEVGDRIRIESERVGQQSRAGVVEEVLMQDPPRLRVRWDDGHESIVAPTSGAAMVEPRQKAKAKATGRTRARAGA
jgi:Domain of unknown function (DUF1918)